MAKYKSISTGEIIESDDLVWSSEFEGYVHSEDVREYYLDDDMTDIEVYEEVE